MTPNEEKEREILRAREKFVEIIKEENFNSYGTKQSLKAHYRGPLEGFSCHILQSRWLEFLAGWLGRAALRAESEPVGEVLRVSSGEVTFYGYVPQPGTKLYTAPQTLPIVEREEP